MDRFKKYLTVFAFSLLILGLPTFASAQWRDLDDDDDYYRTQRDRDNRNNRNYNRGNLRSAVERLKNQSRNFQRRLDRELDRSRYDDRRREDRLNDLARDFSRAAERLEDEFDGGRNLNDSYDEARQVLSLGRQLENALYRARLNYNLQNDWNRIKQDLNTISYAYNYNDRNRRNRGNGGWRNQIPFPFPF
jgi:hypothetical protein